MDFTPILVSILYAPLSGFSLMATDNEKLNLYQFSEFAPGTQLEFQCLDENNIYRTLASALVDSENYNSPDSSFPVHRAAFEDVLKSAPESCVINDIHETTIEPTEQFPCTYFINTSVDASFTFRVVKDGVPVNIWSPAEEANFISRAPDNADLRLMANIVDARSPNLRSFEKREFYSDVYVLKGGAISPANGKACFWDGNDINGYHEDHSVTLSFKLIKIESWIQGETSLLDILYSATYAEGEPDVVLDTSYEILGIDKKYWDMLERWLPKLVEKMK